MSPRVNKMQPRKHEGAKKIKGFSFSCFRVFVVAFEKGHMRIGIDLGGTKIEAIALGEHGDVLLRRRIVTPRDNYEATLGAMVTLVRETELEIGRTGSVGVGIPGTISSDTG